MRSLRLTTGALCAAILLSACSSGGGGNGIGAQAKNAGGTGGDGAVEQLSVGQRGKPLTVSGSVLTGAPWSSATDAKGKVVVLNVWGSWCGPCQTEFGSLQKAWTQLKASGKPVVLMGLDYKEGAATALATTQQRGMTYPSLQYGDGRSISALGGNFNGAPPTTLVLDSQHRIAARVTGPIDDTTLVGLVDDTLSGK
ncbi:TlpA disulfide reductase family protein [Allobranchiibius sp. CTAmp26]|uniref:TlpA family protein disulfide reductase n=1 Tax=Allobranchiibius sp. CTAmp26 TaxID=2815214 RepID=UPI001AA0F731|nr:TlpA disulfide reductase family protein [Allobranchiibius sp. CTAmp26]MBO1753642.1 TlpA family protein disulfide reductase [Allobranchiibius sp. CTAmp26]